MVRLETLLEKIKDTPLSLDYIRKKLPPKCKAVEYKNLNKHRSVLFKDTEAIVVLIPNKGDDIGHFIVLVAKGKQSSHGHIEYFSSLGGNYQSELKKLQQDPEIMKNLLGKNYITNTRKLQQNIYHVNDCAVWCILRCYLRSFKLREFQELFIRKQVLEGSDDIAACLGLLLLIDI